jgi:hypothetical protein
MANQQHKLEKSNKTFKLLLGAVGSLKRADFIVGRPEGIAKIPIRNPPAFGPKIFQQ